MNVLTLSLGPLGTNCHLAWSDTSDEGLLVDCAGDPEAIHAEIERRGLEELLVVFTHGHIDHIDALAGLLHYTKAQVAVHASDAAYLSDPMASGATLFGFPQQAITPDVVLREGNTVSVASGGVSLSVVHTPGHTPGSICLVGEGALFSGDTLFAGGIGRTDLPGGDMTAMEASLARLMELPDDLVVYPGHGPNTTLGEERRNNPWLNDR